MLQKMMLRITQVANYRTTWPKRQFLLSIWPLAAGSYSKERGSCSVCFFSSSLEIHSPLFKYYGLLAQCCPMVMIPTGNWVDGRTFQFDQF